MRQNANQSFRLWAGRLLAVLWLALSIAAPAHAVTDDIHTQHAQGGVELIDGQSGAPEQTDPGKDHFCHSASCHVHWHSERGVANADILPGANSDMAVTHFDYASQIISPDLRPPMS